MRFMGLLLVFACACHGLSRSDREYIRISIETHNIMAQVKYISDLHNETEMLIYKYGHTPEDDSMKSAELATWKARWNNPYWINRDTALTVDKFMEFCEARKLDPKHYVDQIEVK